MNLLTKKFLFSFSLIFFAFLMVAHSEVDPFSGEKNTSAEMQMMCDLVINEVDYDQAGSDTEEFIEIYNPCTDPINLDDYEILLVNGSNGSTYQTIDLPNVDLAAGDYFVVCANNNGGAYCDFTAISSIQNGAPDAISLQLNGVQVDGISYEGDNANTAAVVEGTGTSEADDSTPDISLARFPDGNDTNNNDDDFLRRCTTPGAANLETTTCPPPCDLVINEVDYDQASTDTEEFIEIYNPCTDPINLDDYEILLVNGSNGSTYQTIDLPNVDLAAGDYFVVCANNNGGAYCDFTAISSIQNGAPDAISLQLNGVQVDGISYEGDNANTAAVVEGTGTSEADDSTPDISLARFPDGNDTNNNDDDFLRRCTTPGAANLETTTCPPPVVCAITAITTDNISACSSNGTPTDPSDDIFTADVTITFNDMPATGTLDLTGDGMASVSVSGATSPYTFPAVEMSADGTDISLTATFSADTDCTLTESNAGTAPSACPCNLVINEVDYDQPGTDTEEFIEIYNPCTDPINLNDYDIVLVNGSNGTTYQTVDLPNIDLAAGDYFVVCANNNGGAYCDFTAISSIQNGAPDAISLQLNGIQVDGISYEGDNANTAAVVEGTGTSDADGSTPDISLGRFPDGMDTNNNDDDFLIRCTTPGTANVETTACPPPPSCAITAITTDNLSACDDNGTPGDPSDDFFTADVTVTYENAPATGTLDLSGDGMASVSVTGATSPYTFPAVEMSADGMDISLTAAFSDDPGCTFTENMAGTAPSSCTCGLVINEVDYDQAGTDNGEFIEIYNPCSASINLDDYDIVLVNGSNGSTYQTIDLPNVDLAAGDYFVVCANNNGGAYCDFTAISSIQNGAPDAISLQLNGVQVDGISYEGDNANTAAVVEGTGTSEADDSTPDISLARFPDGMDTNNNDDDFLRRCTTPGAANLPSTSCAPPPPCSITVISLGNISGCDSNGTPADPSDDIFTADVTVTFENAPASGTLDLSGDGMASVSVSGITSPYTFPAVEMSADGMDISLTASFSADQACTFTESNAGTAPEPCPCGLVINEVDYDQPGTDNGEFVEIYNLCTSAVNLDDYELVFVNGSNGSIYQTINLPNVDLAAGDYFVICANNNPGPNCDMAGISSIQNGAPDAISLQLNGVQVDGISYEGDNGNTASVVEGTGTTDADGSTPDISLGRFPDGMDTNNNADDFLIRCTTPGMANVPSTACPPPVGCNITVISTSNITNCDDNDTPSDPSDDTFTADVTVTFVDAPAMGTLDLSGDGMASVSVVGLISPHTFIGVEMTADGTAISLTATFSDQPNCTFTENNAGTAPGSCSCGLVINEVDYDQPGSDNAEFIELYNPCDNAVNLDQYSIVLVNGSNGSTYQTVDLPNVDLAAGEYFVICANNNPSPYCDLVAFSSIQNGAPDAISLRFNGVQVDGVSYEGDVASVVEGSGAGLADLSSGEAVGISRFPNGIDNNMNNEDFSVRCITPGEENSASVSDCLNCGITSIIVSSTSTCNDMGTSDPSDDTFLGEVTVTFDDRPNTGQLVLTGDGIASVGASGLTSPHTFTGVEMDADGMPISLTATFSSLTTCTLTETNAGMAPEPCSPCGIVSIFIGNFSPCDNQGNNDPSDDTFTADVKVEYFQAPTSGTLDLSGDGTASISNFGPNFAYFPAVEFSANGAPITLTASFSAIPACSLTEVVGIAPPPCLDACNIEITDIVAVDEQCSGEGGSITIFVNSTSQAEYSIDGGFTFQTDNTFDNVAPGFYPIVAQVLGFPGCADFGSATILPAPDESLRVWFKDLDGDFHSDGVTLLSCDQPAGYQAPGDLLSLDGDCDDNNPAVNPDVDELCNGIDDNCNGMIDENCLTDPTGSLIVQAPCAGDDCGDSFTVGQSISVFPNPTSGILNLQLAASFESAKVSLVDIRGSVVNHFELSEGTPSAKIETGHLPNGLFILHVLVDGESFTERVVIE